MNKPVHDIFQRGLKRGAERLPFDPAKAYFYVEHPTEGWRVYLRACCFIHEKPKVDECIDTSKFVVVKRTGRDAKGKEWEPPKGQMEGKDGLRHPGDSVMKLLRENVKREVAEESRITQLQGLRHSGIILEDVEPDFPPNTFFQYHVFQALIHPNEFQRAAQELQWYREHPAAFARLRRDKKEKDDIRWYSPSETRIMGRWSPRLVAMYLSAADM
jgi:ADP-ribose pyrophosphatase YjhB (NUDIX family)